MTNLSKEKKELFIKIREQLLTLKLNPTGLTVHGHLSNNGRESLKVFFYPVSGYQVSWYNSKETLFCHTDCVPLEIVLEDIEEFIDMGISDLYATEFLRTIHIFPLVT